MEKNLLNLHMARLKKSAFLITVLILFTSMNIKAQEGPRIDSTTATDKRINTEVQLQDNGWLKIIDQYVESEPAEEFYGRAKFATPKDEQGKIKRKLRVKIQFLRPCKATSRLDDLTEKGHDEIASEDNSSFPVFGYIPSFHCDYHFKVFCTFFKSSKYKEYETIARSLYPQAPMLNIHNDKVQWKTQMVPGETMWMDFFLSEDDTTWHVWVPK